MKENLRIWYRSSDGVLTERVITPVLVTPPNLIEAHCHLRNEQRIFVLKRIEQAVIEPTGEYIPDIWEYFGLQSLRPPKPELPSFPETPQHEPYEKALKQRKQDKRALFSRFKVDVIVNLKKSEFFALFGNQCFKCEQTENLHIDHHIPQHLGGRLVPGNLAVLCKRCNGAKLDRHPREFYSNNELEIITKILREELKIFDFSFDYEFWERDPKGYLLSLGIAELDADEEVRNLARESRIGVRVSVDWSSVKKLSNSDED